MNKKIGLLSMSLLSMTVAACGGGSLGDRTDTSDPSAFCRAAAEQACATMYACLSGEEMRALHLPDDEAACAREYESRCEDGIGDCDDDDHAFASADAAACLDEMEGAVCNDAAEPWLDAPSCQTNMCERVRGTFFVQWQLSDYHQCEETSIGKVGLSIRDEAGIETEALFACDEYAGMTPPVRVTDYTVRFVVYDRTNRLVWASPEVEGTLDEPTVNLGYVEIPLNQ